MVSANEMLEIRFKGIASELERQYGCITDLYERDKQTAIRVAIVETKIALYVGIGSFLGSVGGIAFASFLAWVVRQV